MLTAVFVAIVLLALMGPVYAMGYHRGRLRGMSEKLARQRTGGRPVGSRR